MALKGSGGKGAKRKGSRAEYYVRDAIRNSGLDALCQRQVMSGAIPGLKGDIRTKLPFVFEVKNQETWSPHKWYLQAVAEKNLGDRRVPIVVMTRNGLGYYSFLDFDDLLTILFYAVKGGYITD